MIKLRAPGTTKMMVHSAVSVYNINVIQQLDDFVSTHFPAMTFDTQVVQFPLHLSTRNLPLDYKQLVKAELGDRYPTLVEYMMKDGEDLFGHFVNFHNKLNELRNEDFKTLNPLLANYIANYENVPAWEETKAYLIKAQQDLKSM